MATLRINIEMDNASFEHQGRETARILKAYAKWIEHDSEIENDKRLMDVNGNTVGRAWVES